VGLKATVYLRRPLGRPRSGDRLLQVEARRCPKRIDRTGRARCPNEAGQDLHDLVFFGRRDASPHDPTRPFWDFDICLLHSHLAQWEQAVEPCRRAIQAIPSLWYPYVFLIAAYAFLGRDAEAKAESAKLLKLNPHFNIKGFVSFASTFTDNVIFNQQIARMAEGLRKTGLPEHQAPVRGA
jgi:tetratricopeptide (TPR) repeat protein